MKQKIATKDPMLPLGYAMMLSGAGGGWRGSIGDIVQWYPTVTYALSDYNNIL